MYSYQEASYGEFQIWLIMLASFLGDFSLNDTNVYYTFKYKVKEENITLWLNPYKSESENAFLCKNDKCEDNIIVPAISVMRLINKYEGVAVKLPLSVIPSES